MPNRSKLSPWYQRVLIFVISSLAVFGVSLAVAYADAPSPSADPNNWKLFDPTKFGDQADLVPAALYPYGVPQTAGTPTTGSCGSLDKYTAGPKFSFKPSKCGVMVHGTHTQIFAHQGTPIKTGLSGVVPATVAAPIAGACIHLRAAQGNNTCTVCGLTNYTPVNYSGQLSQYLATPLTGTAAKLGYVYITDSKGNRFVDLNRVFFTSNHKGGFAVPTSPTGDSTTDPTPGWPSAIYLKQGETATVAGKPWPCPKAGDPPTTDIQIDTSGIKHLYVIFRLPESPITPGTVTP